MRANSTSSDGAITTKSGKEVRGHHRQGPDDPRFSPAAKEKKSAAPRATDAAPADAATVAEGFEPDILGLFIGPDLVDGEADPHPLPPHIVLYLENLWDLAEADEGTRASMNGQVPASETYQTWLKRQPAGFQDDVLGVQRASLFRQGKLTVDKFVDESGKVYTMEQLRAKHPAAF